VLAAVGNALRYIHAENVLHRDVKPANILLARQARRIKLGDFGISKLMEATGRAHTVVGTPHYLAPEIVSGQPYGAAADAWALGVCLYELAALRRPFDANNPLALMRRICEEPPVPLVNNTAPDIEQVIWCLIEKDPEHRLPITDALSISREVETLAALSTSLFDESSTQSPAPSLQDDLSWDLTQDGSVPTSVLSPVSTVSIATSESGCGSSLDTEIFTSLCGQDERTLAPFCANPNLIEEALAQARAALASEVDDPEELQAALHVLEGHATSVDHLLLDAVKALCSELHFRVAALRADATTILENLVEQHPVQHSTSVPASAAALPFRSAAPPGWHVIHHPDANNVIASNDQIQDTIMTVISNDVDGCVGALETAIEVATTLGVDTRVAEERAASNRGLLSLRITYATSVRFCLMPVGASFDSIVVEIMRRFTLRTDVANTSGKAPPPFRLFWSDGSDTRQLRDQASWDACLCHCGLQGKPGRMQLHLEMPFMITGTRVCSSVRRVGGQMVARHAAIDGSARSVKPKMDAERHVGKNLASVRKSGRQVVPLGELPARPPQARRKCRVGSAPNAGFSVAAALCLEGRGAAQ
jgi:hypothetical protein